MSAIVAIVSSGVRLLAVSLSCLAGRYNVIIPLRVDLTSRGAWRRGSPFRLL